MQINHRKNLFNSFFLMGILLVVPSCKYKKIGYAFQTKRMSNSLFVEMPHNSLIFEQISADLYEALWEQFNRAGYNLVCSSHNTDKLRIKIISFDGVDQLISPDVMLYGYKIHLTLLCQLYDQDDMLIGEQTFHFYKWIYKSKNPVCNRDYLSYQYHELFVEIAPRIELYIRSLLLRKLKS